MSNLDKTCSVKNFLHMKFLRLPTLAVYTWDMLSGPSRDGSDLWSRRATRQILLDLSMFDIFDLDDPCLGLVHI